MIRKKQDATALISAIFIVAIVAVLATAIAVRQRLIIYNAELVTANNRAYLALQFAQHWAVAELDRYAKYLALEKKQRRHTRFRMKMKFGPEKIMQVRVRAKLIDQQGLYDIDNLVRTAEIPGFARLLRTVDSKFAQRQALRQGALISQWMQRDADDSFYLKQNPPYRAAHQQMVDISTLRAVRGINATLFIDLRKYLTAIPLSNQNLAININSVTAPVLLAYTPKLSLAKAQAIVQCRRRYRHFNTVSDFDNACVKPLKVADLKNVTVVSKYFVLQAVANYSGQRYVLTSMLQIAKDKKTKRFVVRVVWQKIS